LSNLTIEVCSLFFEFECDTISQKELFMLSHVVNTTRDTGDMSVLMKRERVARELHDSVIQSALGLILSVQAIAGGAPDSALLRQCIEAAIDQAERHAITAVQAVLRVLAAEPDPVAAPSDQNNEKRPDGIVTARERSILLLIGQGFSNKEIARRLNIAPETVKSHIARILSKLGASTRAHAVACAAKLSLLSEA
jgi:ATP/maltotriose-dependent transcriptional regulator MalT